MELIPPGLAAVGPAGSSWGDHPHGCDWDGQKGTCDIVGW